jgi:hypothetical protein
MEKPRTRRPGEAAFALALVAFSGWALWASYGIAGFDRLSGAGAVPMLASAVMMVSALVILRDVLARAPAAPGLRAARRFLAPPRLLPFMVLMLGFAFAIGPLGFLPAASAFTLLALLLLWRRGPLWAAGVTALAIAVIWGLFRVLFQVVLPTGTLWRDMGL